MSPGPNTAAAATGMLDCPQPLMRAGDGSGWESSPLLVAAMLTPYLTVVVRVAPLAPVWVRVVVSKRPDPS